MDAKIFMEVLNAIYEYSENTVDEALCKLESISPIYTIGNKVALICVKRGTLKQADSKVDYLSRNLKVLFATLSQ